MTRNESTLDRAIRILVGATLLFLVFTGRIGAWGWLGFVPLLTGALGFCPLYSVLGWSTCRRTGRAGA